MRDIRRVEHRRKIRYGSAPIQNLILEDVGSDEAPVTLLEIVGEWLPLQFDDKRVVATDAEPSRGRVDWVFWIRASQVPSRELIEQAATALFNGERYQIDSIHFFAGEPAHWELLAFRMHAVNSIPG